MKRFLHARTFTCRRCKTRKGPGDLATATSQAGLCIDCYAEGYRLEHHFYGRGLTHTTDVLWWPSRVPVSVAKALEISARRRDMQLEDRHSGLAASGSQSLGQIRCAGDLMVDPV